LTGFGKVIVKLYTVASTDGDEDDERQDDAEEFGGVSAIVLSSQIKSCGKDDTNVDKSRLESVIVIISSFDDISEINCLSIINCGRLCLFS